MPPLFRRRDWRRLHEMPRDWRERIRVGDVLRAPSGDLRVVRYVRFMRDGFLGSVDFAIRRCTWTGSCLTLVSRTDLRTRGFEPTGVHYEHKTPMDGRIRLEVLKARGRHCRTTHCCDVKGVP